MNARIGRRLAGGVQGALLLFVLVAAASAQGTVIELKNKFIANYKDKILAEIDFDVDEIGKIHSPGQDGDLHFSGRSDAIGLPIVGEIMNAKYYKKPIADLRAAQGNRIKLTGVWRLWCEHAGTGKQIKSDKKRGPFDDANPDHVFEIHPVTKIGTESVLESLKPIAGYTKPGEKNRPAKAFAKFEGNNFVIIPDKAKGTTTLKASAVGYNYIEFYLTVRTKPMFVEGGTIVIGDALDLEEEIAARNVRMLFVKDSAPDNVVRKLKVGETMHVLGTPRISLALVQERVDNGELDLPLPYEMVIVGVYEEEKDIALHAVKQRKSMVKASDDEQPEKSVAKPSPQKPTAQLPDEPPEKQPATKPSVTVCDNIAEHTTWLFDICSLEAAIWCLYLVMLVVLTAPVLYFLVFSWRRRRDDMMNSMSDQAAAYYFNAFHGAEHADLRLGISAWEVARQGHDAEVARAQKVADQARVEQGAGNLEAAENMQKEASEIRQASESALQKADASFAPLAARAKQRFGTYFDKEFSRQRFFWPLILLLVTAVLFLFIVAHEVLNWMSHHTAAHGWVPAAVIFGILGGYTWVVFDHITRMSNEDFRPVDLYWSTFRLVIAVPSAYAFSYVFPASWSLGMAYLLGTLPTGTIMATGRRILAQRMPLEEKTGSQSQVQNLLSVDTYIAERLLGEGITSYVQLAYVDPVRLSIRTGLNFSVSVTLAGESLVALYVANLSQFEIYRKYGLFGSFEVATLWAEYNDDDVATRQRAMTIVNDLATKLGIVPEALVKNVMEIALDPFTVFQRACWASNMRSAK